MQPQIRGLRKVSVCEHKDACIDFLALKETTKKVIVLEEVFTLLKPQIQYGGVSHGVAGGGAAGVILADVVRLNVCHDVGKNSILTDNPVHTNVRQNEVPPEDHV